MNIDELARTLPNGFHDAGLRGFTMDYVARTLNLALDVWTGDMDDPNRREAYRPADVRLADVAYLAIEPPDERQPWLDGESIRIDAGVGQPPKSQYTVPAQPVGSFQAWVYLGELNTFLHVVAKDASLQWAGDERVAR
jgi:hypothetical protein